MIWIAIWALLDFASAAQEPPHPEIPSIVEEYFGEETITALGVFWCESLHLPTAVSKTDDHGLAQLSQKWWGPEAFGEERWGQRYEIRANIAMSYEIWAYGEHSKGDGWLMWACGRDI